MRRMRFFISIICLGTALFHLGAVEIRDKIRTVDGEIVSGRIVERYPGTEYHIDTDAGLQIIPVGQIEWIEKTVPDPAEDLFVYTDIVYLNSGLILHGTIVAEEIQGDITLISHNGAAISIPIDRIWRITHEKRAAMVPAKGIEKNSRVQKVRRDFAIELTVQRLESEEEKPAGSEEDDTDRVEQLRDELAELEEESAAAAEQQEKDDEFVAALLDEIARDKREAAESLTELARRAAVCATENPEGMTRIADLYANSIAGINDAALLADTLNDIDPGIVREIRKAEEAANLAELEVMMNGNLHDPDNIQRIIALSQQIPEEDRRDLFRSSRQKNPVDAAVINGLIPVGGGSMKQGDKLGVAIQAGTFLIGGLLVLDSLIGNQLDNPEEPALDWYGWIGAGIGGSGYVYSLIRPFLYASRQNERARRALLLEGDGYEE